MDINQFVSSRNRVLFWEIQISPHILRGCVFQGGRYAPASRVEDKGVGPAIFTMTISVSREKEACGKSIKRSWSYSTLRSTSLDSPSGQYTKK
jgi:hypothetical protein